MAPTTNNLDSLLSIFAASYQKPEVEVKIATAKAPSTQKLVKVAKATDGKIAKVEETAKAPSPAPFMAGKVLPCKGTLDARQFIKAMNTAKDRDDRIIAISGFVGFDVARPIGEQEIAAFNEARRIMRPMTVVDVNEPFKGRVAATVAGFVSGMPDANKRQIENLMARERQAVRAMGEALASGGEMAEARIAVEQARVDAIRADLKNLLLGATKVKRKGRASKLPFLFLFQNGLGMKFAICIQCATHTHKHVDVSEPID